MHYHLPIFGNVIKGTFGRKFEFSFLGILQFSFSGIRFAKMLSSEIAFLNMCFSKAFDRQIKFPGIFCIFPKIMLAEGNRPVTKGSGW